MLEYISFRAYETELEVRLNEYAKLGFQVTTCEPIVVPAADSLTVSVSFIIIMTRFPTTPPGDSVEKEPEVEGIAMTG